jgi:hypothetical protein
MAWVEITPVDRVRKNRCNIGVIRVAKGFDYPSLLHSTYILHSHNKSLDDRLRLWNRKGKFCKQRHIMESGFGIYSFSFI